MPHCSTTRVATCMLAVLVLGCVCLAPLGGCNTPDDDARQGVSDPATQYTCAMHPHIRQPKPGACPICGMALIPATSPSESPEQVDDGVALGPAARARAEIMTAAVERKWVPVEVRLAGKVTVDETREAHITARVPGRLEKLYVNYTGVDVQSNEHLALLYSQSLYVMQAEYMIARSGGASGARAGRERLLLAGMTEAQVEELERTGAPHLYLTLYAPLSGTVIEKSGVEGMYVDVGTRIFTVADLSRVWAVFEAYETDLPWLRYGQRVVFTTDVHPGMTYTGHVAFIAPVLDEQTRTVRVRVNVDNHARTLKPGFLVRGVVHATVAGAGRVIEPSLVGKWMCPMHPEVIASAASTCSECGMALQPVTALGYSPIDTNDVPLVIPATAPLLTGTRAIVYVEDSARRGTFAARAVELGPRAGDYYLVYNGLSEGERVVVQGNFKIDSTFQLRGLPSMINPRQAAPARVPASASLFSSQMVSFVSVYLRAVQALAQDDMAAARAQARTAASLLTNITPAGYDAAVRAAWPAISSNLHAGCSGMLAADDLHQMRDSFWQLSQGVLAAVRAFHLSGTPAWYAAHCPMAFDDAGAEWLQDAREIANPYFGAQMLRCGEITETFEPLPPDHR